MSVENPILNVNDNVALKVDTDVKGITPEIKKEQTDQNNTKLLTQKEIRAQKAQLLIKKLQENNAKYVQETKIENNVKISNRDWKDYTKSDCSKFVQWSLELSGQGSLFGRENATTNCIKDKIKQLEGKLELRKINPVIGDLMLWGGHVAIVSSLDKEEHLLTVSQMGLNSNAKNHKIPMPPGIPFDRRVDGYTDNKGKKISGLGSGGFLGFWTPPDTTD